ncbi:hypothetical protein H0H81_002431 [Sphagnurus paluster]|uniref:Uncharacterized protein n=1 Tax=Sphagnurus paluster TaxID=117069 RepID=A0A9P7GFP3_9AGAR|nr:hypothetical protein H0H81_002431 [Sphagnurus paluster]
MAHPPLAGKPPFATDLPDSFYEQQPAQPRQRQQPPPNPNARTSAYDVYNNYITDDNRQSGAGALGLGLLNMADDSDDEDDDDNHSHASHASKHAALAAATAKPIAAPQPGYAAPIAALNLARGPQSRPPALQIPAPVAMPSPQTFLANPFDDPQPQSRMQPPLKSPSPTPSTPHPLQAPMTPITPVFARPAKTAPGISFAAGPAPSRIIRGQAEEAIIPSRGEKGDDFWRRFSMVAKEENRKPATQKTSVWLSKTQSGSTRLSRWVWITGIILLIVRPLLCAPPACPNHPQIIGAAIGLGWYVSHNKPDHQQPKAFGGSANEAATASTSATVDPSTGSTVKHVSPTHTLASRVEPSVLAAPVRRSHAHAHKKRRQLAH